MNKRQSSLSMIIGIGLLLGLLWLNNRAQSPAPQPNPTSVSRASQPTKTPSAAKPTPRSKPAAPTAARQTDENGFSIIAAADLPPEARTTLDLIERGGPFPFDQDGATFGNRERILPLKAKGYYQEYTVITPRSADRGARRIVAGDGGELYYTADHYASFKRIEQ